MVSAAHEIIRAYMSPVVIHVRRQQIQKGEVVEGFLSLTITCACESLAVESDNAEVSQWMGTYRMIRLSKRAPGEHPVYLKDVSAGAAGGENEPAVYMAHLLDTHVAIKHSSDGEMSERDRIRAHTIERAEMEGKDIWIIGGKRKASLSSKHLYVHTHSPVPERITSQEPRFDDPDENHWIIDNSKFGHHTVNLNIKCEAADSPTSSSQMGGVTAQSFSTSKGWADLDVLIGDPLHKPTPLFGGIVLLLVLGVYCSMGGRKWKHRWVICDD